MIQKEGKSIEKLFQTFNEKHHILLCAIECLNIFTFCFVFLCITFQMQIFFYPLHLFYYLNHSTLPIKGTEMDGRSHYNFRSKTQDIAGKTHIDFTNVATALS